MFNIRRVLLFVVVLFGIILVSAIALPFVFKDEVKVAVKELVNENVNATVDFSDVGLSLLKNFPNLTICIDDLAVIGKDEFEGLNLVNASSIELTTNLMAAYRDPNNLKIKKFLIKDGKVHVVILPQGKANYDVTKPTEEATTETQAWSAKMEGYRLENCDIIYDDQQGGMYLKMKGLDHRGKGNFSASKFDLTTKTTAEAITFKSGGVAYLTKVKSALDAIIGVDLNSATYTFNNATAVLNNLDIAANGFVHLLPKDAMEVDINFQAPKSDFKSLLSLIPAIYTKEFSQMDADGQFALSGLVKGTLNTSNEIYPAVDMKLNIANGRFQYPNLPKSVEQISIQSHIQMPEGSLDGLRIDVPSFIMNIGGDPIAGNLEVRHPISNPTLKLKLDTKLNLAHLAQAYPMPELSTLAGQLDANLFIDASMNQYTSKAYDKMIVKGDIILDKLNIKPKDYPRVTATTIKASFSPKFVDVPQADLTLGQSDVAFVGRIDNILAIVSPETTLKGAFKVRSNTLNLNEWMPTESAEVEPSTISTTNDDMFDRFDIKLDAEIGNVVYESYSIQHVDLKGDATPNNLNIEQASLLINDSDLAMNGNLKNLWDYLLKEGTLAGNINLHSKSLNINKLMTESTQTIPSEKTETNPAVYQVPDRMNINMQADIGDLVYDKYQLTNLTGGINIANKKAVLEDCIANFLDGRMALAGSYNTQNKEPLFDLIYSMEKMKFHEFYDEFGTVRALAPIFEYIQGIFNTTFKMSGKLGPDLMPDYSTLSASGYLETLNGFIEGLKPLTKLSNQLNVTDIGQVTIKNTKNWFEVNDGRVELKPYDIAFKGINMNVSGFTKIKGPMDMNIDMLVPRKMVESNPVGAAANEGLNFIKSQASKLGLNINTGDNYRFKVKLSGMLDAPEVAVKLVGMEGESMDQTIKSTATDIAKAAVDSARIVASEKTEEIKNKAIEQAQTAADEVTAKATEEAQKAANKAKDEVKKQLDEAGGAAIDSIANDIGKHINDNLGDEAKDAVDEAKKKLEQWNPFGKKAKKDD